MYKHLDVTAFVDTGMQFQKPHNAACGIPFLVMCYHQPENVL